MNQDLESNHPEEEIEVEHVLKKQLTTVTPFSKYAAVVLLIVLLIVLPFVGGWIGYQYAPEKIVEVEREVIMEVEEESSPVSKKKIYVNDEFGFEFKYEEIYKIQLEEENFAPLALTIFMPDVFNTTVVSVSKGSTQEVIDGLITTGGKLVADNLVMDGDIEWRYVIIEFNNGKKKYHFYYIEHGGWRYEINTNVSIDLLRKISDTFKFTDN